MKEANEEVKKLVDEETEQLKRGLISQLEEKLESILGQSEGEWARKIEQRVAKRKGRTIRGDKIPPEFMPAGQRAKMLISMRLEETIKAVKKAFEIKPEVKMYTKSKRRK